MLTAHL